MKKNTYFFENFDAYNFLIGPKIQKIKTFIN